MSICIDWQAVSAVATLIVAIVAVVAPILQNRKWHRINADLQQKNAQISRNTQMYNTFNYLSVKTIKIVSRRNNLQGIDITSRTLELVGKDEKVALNQSDKYDFMMFDVQVNCSALRDIPIKEVDVHGLFIDKEKMFGIEEDADKSQIVDCTEMVDFGGNLGNYNYSFTVKTSLDWDNFLRAIDDSKANYSGIYLVASYINIVGVSVTCVHELELEYLSGSVSDIFNVKREMLVRLSIDNYNDSDIQ